MKGIIKRDVFRSLMPFKGKDLVIPIEAKRHVRSRLNNNELLIHRVEIIYNRSGESMKKVLTFDHLNGSCRESSFKVNIQSKDR